MTWALPSCPGSLLIPILRFLLSAYVVIISRDLNGALSHLGALCVLLFCPTSRSHSSRWHSDNPMPSLTCPQCDLLSGLCGTSVSLCLSERRGFFKYLFIVAPRIHRGLGSRKPCGYQNPRTLKPFVGPLCLHVPHLWTQRADDI